MSNCHKTLKMKKILIPSDFSLNSYQTIDYITELFKNEYCEFYLLNSYDFEVSGLNAIEMLQADDDWFDKPKEESIDQLGKLVERYTFKAQNTKHEFHAISDNMKLIDSIKKNASELSVDLIVLTGRADKNIGKKTKAILKKIRFCPILIVPPHTCITKSIHLTIASNFQEKINTLEIHKFIKILENTNIKIRILVLEEENTLTTEATNNLESLLLYLNQIFTKRIGLEYVKPSYRLKDYAAAHLAGIVCVIDKKPDLFRRIGLIKSNIIPTLMKLQSNTVLTVHQ